MNIAELGICLGEWLNEIQRGNNQTMHFNTIDHDESILDFFYVGQENWRIHSIWQEFEADESIHTLNLREAVKQYVYDLNNELKK